MKETLLNLLAAISLGTNVEVSEMAVKYTKTLEVKFEKLKRNPYITPVYSPKALDLVFMESNIGILVDDHVVFYFGSNKEVVCDLLHNVDAKMFGRPSKVRNTSNLVMYHFKSFKNYMKVKPIVEQVSYESGIPLEILTSMIYQESKFNKHAKSHTNVRGLTMITRATAKRYNIDTTTTLGQIRGMATIFNSIMEQLPKSRYTLEERYKLASFCYNRGTKHYLQVISSLQKNNKRVTYKAVIQQLRKCHYCNEGIKYVKRVSTYSAMFA